MRIPTTRNISYAMRSIALFLLAMLIMLPFSSYAQMETQAQPQGEPAPAESAKQSDTQTADAPPPFDLKEFNVLPVLHEGRVKPLYSMAYSLVKRYGQSELTPAAWLAEAVFDPQNASIRPLFNISDGALKAMLSLPQEQNTFSLRELQSGLETTKDKAIELAQQDTNELSSLQKALLQTHENAIDFAQLLRSLSMMHSLEGNIPAEIEKALKDSPHSFIHLYPYIEDLPEDMQQRLQIIALAGLENNALRIIPEALTAEPYTSPWVMVQKGISAPLSMLTFQSWQAMATAYENRNSAAWDAALTNAATLQKHSNASASKIFLIEWIYLATQPYNAAMLLYAAAFICAALRKRRLSLASLSLAIIIHGSAIAARIAILDRPPVGTLYESLLFVALICAVSSLYTSLRVQGEQKDIWLGAGSLLSGALLTLAPVIKGDSEGLDILVAVLNTNFWLATHVLCITTGYGACLICSALAHTNLACRAFNAPAKRISTLHSMVIRTSMWALLLTAVGTALGGIWADQSWGRFWGWDPKENGALLIVLWLIWLQHGHISSKLSALSHEMAAAALSIIVALAWFGVNLLGVGLHSYGFTSGLALGLAVFCCAQSAVILALGFAAHKVKNKKALA